MRFRKSETLKSIESLHRYYIKNTGTHLAGSFIDSSRTELYRIQTTRKAYFSKHGIFLNLPKIFKRRRFSKYEPSLSIYFLHSHYSIFKKLARKSLISDPKSIYYATLPIGTVNAKVIQSPNKDSIILLNEGLFLFHYYLVISLIGGMTFLVTDKYTKIPIGGILEINLKKLESKSMYTDLFKDVLVSYLKKGNTSHLKYKLNDSYGIYVKDYTVVSNFFVTAHEYGHIVLHIKKTQPNELGYFRKHVKAGDLKHDSWLEEYESDAFAAYCAINYFSMMKGMPIDKCLHGIEAFFSFLEVLFLIKNEPIQVSHPPIKKRLNLCYRFMELEFKGIKSELTGKKGWVRQLVLKQWNVNKKDILSELNSQID
ncbi:MAG: hypothetical protein KDC34_18765 [Saprospiraceae bacterium]|nr:hypothetical protein [Saprospiraceae bacterium]